MTERGVFDQRCVLDHEINEKINFEYNNIAFGMKIQALPKYPNTPPDTQNIKFP